MTWGAVAIGGAALVGGYMSSQASGRAADAQSAASQAGIAEQQRQFDAIQKLLAPYVSVGNQGLSGQQDLLGLNGQAAQRSAIGAIQNGPQFAALRQQGENSILANASATGGLRGGNTQAALAQFSPQLLNQLIDQQYSRLGGLTSLGQNSAVMHGNAGMQSGNAITNLLQQQGAAQAGAALAGGNATANMINGLANAAGMYFGSQNGFGGSGVVSGGGGLTANNGATLGGGRF